MKFRLQCPVTGTQFSARVEINGQIVARYWGKKIELFCPLCRRLHEFDFKKEYVAASIADADNQAAATFTLYA